MEEANVATQSGVVFVDEPKMETTTNENELQVGRSCMEQAQQVQHTDVSNETHLSNENVLSCNMNHEDQTINKLTGNNDSPDSRERIPLSSEVVKPKVSFLLEPSWPQHSEDIQRGLLSVEENTPSPSPLSEQQLQKGAKPANINDPLCRKTQSLTLQNPNIVQQEIRNYASSSRIHLARDSLGISQPAHRSGIYIKSPQNKAKRSLGNFRSPINIHHDSRYRTRSLGRSLGPATNLEKPIRFAKDSLQIPQPAHRRNIAGIPMEHSSPCSSNGKAEVLFNEMQFTHKNHLPLPDQRKTKQNRDERTKMPGSKRPRVSSVDDKLIANLTSAWYWTGYYAGYQERISEE